MRRPAATADAGCKPCVAGCAAAHVSAGIEPCGYCGGPGAGAGLPNLNTGRGEGVPAAKDRDSASEFTEPALPT